MLQQFMQAALEGTKEMLSTMMFLEGEETGDIPQHIDISGVVSFTGEVVSGIVAISLDRKTAGALVAQMLGMTPEEVDNESLKDGVGEMINIIAGQMKVHFSDTSHGFEISLPSIIQGEDHKLELFHGKEVDYRAIATELGTIKISIWLSSDK